MVTWAQDVFGNAVATATFQTMTDALVIDSVAELERFCHASRHAAGSMGSAFLGLPPDGTVGADCDGLRRL